MDSKSLQKTLSVLMALKEGLIKAKIFDIKTKKMTADTTTNDETERKRLSEKAPPRPKMPEQSNPYADHGSFIPKDDRSVNDEVIKYEQNGQWSLEKGAALKIDKGHSVFEQNHVNQIAAMKDHGAAKKTAHEIVDNNKTINPKNRAKVKAMIDNAKSPAHLAIGMQNHILAHPSEGLKVVKPGE